MNKEDSPSLEGQAEEVVPSQFHCDCNSAGMLGLLGSAPEAKFQNFQNRKNNYYNETMRFQCSGNVS